MWMRTFSIVLKLCFPRDCVSRCKREVVWRASPVGKTKAGKVKIRSMFGTVRGSRTRGAPQRPWENNCFYVREGSAGDFFLIVIFRFRIYRGKAWKCLVTSTSRGLRIRRITVDSINGWPLGPVEKEEWLPWIATLNASRCDASKRDQNLTWKTLSPSLYNSKV